MDWFGKTIRWQHVGWTTATWPCKGGGEGARPDWQTHRLGVKHLGFVVSDLDAVVRRLTEAGFPVDHGVPDHPHRRRVYFSPDDLVQAEFIQYLSEARSNGTATPIDLATAWDRAHVLTHGSRHAAHGRHVHFQPWSGVSLGPGQLYQPILPGWQFSGLTVNLGSSSNPAIEQAALDAVGAMANRLATWPRRWRC